MTALESSCGRHPHLDYGNRKRHTCPFRHPWRLDWLAAERLVPTLSEASSACAMPGCFPSPQIYCWMSRQPSRSIASDPGALPVSDLPHGAPA